MLATFYRRAIFISRTFSSGFHEEELKLLSNFKDGKSIKAYLPRVGSVPPPEVIPRLVVVMVGWAQSRHSALSKYASVYTQLGLPCVVVASPVHLLWFTSLGKIVSRRVLGLLDDSLEHPVSILFHIFSGGGCVLFPQLLEEYTRPDSGPFPSKLHPVGAVFDSAPTLFSRGVGLAAAKLVYKQGGFNTFTYSAANLTGLLVDLVIGSRKRLEDKMALTHPLLLQLPQLYLYSKKDSVNPFERIESVIEGQRARGREVIGKCWTDTEHVRHHPKHPEEYTKEIIDFIASLSIKK
jgi:hypothetical protein